MDPKNVEHIRKQRVTKAEMLEELVKCTRSPRYYLNTYGKVYNAKKGYVPFELFGYQDGILYEFEDKRFNIILKSRQTGLSTLAAGYIAWMLCFHRAKEVVVVADKQENAVNFIRKVKSIIRKSPRWLVPNILTDNKKSIEMSTGSKVTAHATTSNAARSESLSLLVIDEAAIINTNKVDDLWAAAYPTLSMGGSAIIISTPKGVGNFYHKQWEKAVNKQSDFNPIMVHWTQHPIYSKDLTWVCSYIDPDTSDPCDHVQLNGDVFSNVPCEKCGNQTLKPTSPWYVTACNQLGDPRKVAQEYNMDFLGSGDNVILDEFIKEAEKNVRVPIRTGGFDHNLWVWQEPLPEVKYLICADVARGDGSDYSGAHVLRQDTKEQVAEYRGKVPPDLYADFLCELGYQYNKAHLVVEANSIGYGTCLKLVENEYPNIYYSIKGQYSSKNKNKLDKALRTKENMVPGFQTSSASRPLVVASLEEHIRRKTVIVHSSRLISELRTLIWNNGKPEAMSGYNDDLSMSLGIGLLVMGTTLKDMQASRDLLMASLKVIGNSYDFTSSDMATTHGAFRNARNSNPWVMHDRSGEVTDLTWLIDRRKTKV